MCLHLEHFLVCRINNVNSDPIIVGFYPENIVVTLMTRWKRQILRKVFFCTNTELLQHREYLMWNI